MLDQVTYVQIRYIGILSEKEWKLKNQLVIIICDSTYQKVPVIGRLDFELWECKVKISQNMVNFEILHIVESSLLT